MAVLGALVLASGAQAAEAGEGSIVEVGVISEAAPAAPETVLSGPTPVAAPETILSGSGSGPEAAPPPSEPVPSSPALPPVAKSPEAAPPVPVPAPETVQLTPAPEAVTQTPASGPEKTPEAVLSGAAAAGKEQETLVSGSVSSGQGSALLVAPASGGPQPPVGGLPPAGFGLPEVAAASGVGPATVGVAAKMTVAQRDRQFDCALSSFGEHAAGSCSAGWLGAQRLLSQSPIGLAATVASVAASASSPPTGGHGGSGSASPPVNPAPGPMPAPSGASGSAAGSSGIALSGFLTLAGLLLLGAPRAMRRLRLSCQPWRTACFVLIPERPG